MAKAPRIAGLLRSWGRARRRRYERVRTRVETIRAAPSVPGGVQIARSASVRSAQSERVLPVLVHALGRRDATGFARWRGSKELRAVVGGCAGPVTGRWPVVCRGRRFSARTSATLLSRLVRERRRAVCRLIGPRIASRTRARPHRAGCAADRERVAVVDRDVQTLSGRRGCGDAARWQAGGVRRLRAAVAEPQ